MAVGVSSRAGAVCLSVCAGGGDFHDCWGELQCWRCVCVWLSETSMTSVWPGSSVSFTAIPPGPCPISSDLGSQARSGPVSTWMGDRLGIPGAVSILLEGVKKTKEIILMINV